MAVARRLVFILSCHIRAVFDARALSLVLFALRRYHPTCKVVLVDNSSPIRITRARLPSAEWINGDNVAIVLNSPSTTREYGAYAKGLAYLLGVGFENYVSQYRIFNRQQQLFIENSCS